MTVERTRATIAAYLEALIGNRSHGALLAPDATLTIMESGEVTRGREAVAERIAGLHARAFAATVEITSLVVDEGRAMVEAVFGGVHTGEFAGIAPTGRAVRVPYVAAYDVAGDAITAVRLYLPDEALVRHLWSAESADAQTG